MEQNRVLVIDGTTDATETAALVQIAFPVIGKAGAWTWGDRAEVAGEIVRYLYDSPSAESYAEGSYTISVEDWRTARNRTTLAVFD